MDKPAKSPLLWRLRLGPWAGVQPETGAVKKPAPEKTRPTRFTNGVSDRRSVKNQNKTKPKIRIKKIEERCKIDPILKRFHGENLNFS